ncbi:MAG: tyrosine--tRNA ligase [Candidatus Pacebacteria bacterium]|nr:tyrosine--tRNA ligase [Candidatus Paceibacterota bacterium]
MSNKLNTNLEEINKVLERGVEQILPKKETLAKLMSERVITLYLGIDPTGHQLHLGHSVPLRKLQDFAELGHRVILLVGNGTVKIGDPTGHDQSRPMLSDEEIKANFANWQRQASKILDFSLIEIRHNADWLDRLTYSDLLKLMAKATVQQLLERDMFQNRLKKNLPIYAHEIIYPLLQGYDSVVMDVDLEIGGRDQTFNMLMGRQLQNVYQQKEKWVLSTPLIEGTDGRKMGKSFNNYIALDDSPVDIYGKIMSISDDLIIKYFEVLTRVDMLQIQEMKQALDRGENPMLFKKELARQITADLYDQEASLKASEHFQAIVQNKATPDLEEFTELIIEINEKNGQLSSSNNIFSNSELGRLLEQGAVKLLPEQKTINSWQELLALANDSQLKIGKHRFYQLKIKR